MNVLITMNYDNDEMNYIYYDIKDEQNHEKIADETLKFLKNENISDYNFISIVSVNSRIYVHGTSKSIEEIKEYIDPIYFGGKGWYEESYKSSNKFLNENELENSYIVGKTLNSIEEINCDLDEISLNKENVIIDNIIDKIRYFDKEFTELYEQLSEIKNLIYLEKK